MKHLALLIEPLAYHSALLVAIAVVFAVCCRASSRRGAAAVQLAAIVAFLLVIDARIRSLPLLFTVIPLSLITVDAIFYRSTIGTPRRRLASTAVVAFLFVLGLSQTPLDQVENFELSDAEAAIERRIDRFEPVANSPVRTDLGRVVAVREYRGDVAGLDADIRRLQESLIESHHLTGRVIALPTVWETSNCHGHVFVGGKLWVPNEEVPGILEDNGYALISMPKIGDLAIYRGKGGAIAHSGVVVGATDGTWLVQSKWGKLGCFVHPSDIYLAPGLTCEFYRSNRDGHGLRFKE